MRGVGLKQAGIASDSSTEEEVSEEQNRPRVGEFLAEPVVESSAPADEQVGLPPLATFLAQRGVPGLSSLPRPQEPPTVLPSIGRLNIPFEPNFLRGPSTLPSGVHPVQLFGMDSRATLTRRVSAEFLANVHRASLDRGTAPGGKRQFDEVETTLETHPQTLPRPSQPQERALPEPPPAAEVEHPAVPNATGDWSTFRNIGALATRVRGRPCTPALNVILDSRSPRELFANSDMLGGPARRPLLHLARTLVQNGHAAEAGILTALWWSFGCAPPPEIEVDEVMNMLPKDGQGQPMWPAIFSEVREERLKALLRRGTGSLTELAAPMLRNPE
jgi:hypothetical protein